MAVPADIMGKKGGGAMQTIQDAKILVVDDNRELRNLIKEELTGAGYRAVRMADSAAAARQATSGFSLFREIRGRSDIPILFLSARDADSDRLFGLGLGADDYMTKPFLMQSCFCGFPESSGGRTGAVTAGNRPSTGRTHGGFKRRHGFVGGRHGHADGDGARHSAKLLDNRGHIVTYDALCEAVWGSDYYGCENSLNVHIRHLREKVEEQPSQPVWILTVRGLGYKLAKEGTK